MEKSRKVQFQVCFDCWLKKWGCIFASLASIWSKYILKFHQDEDLFITLSIVYFQISATYLKEFLNILLYVVANPVWMCR